MNCWTATFPKNIVGCGFDDDDDDDASIQGEDNVEYDPESDSDADDEIDQPLLPQPAIQLVGRDGTVWSVQPGNQRRAAAHNILRERGGPTVHANPDTPDDGATFVKFAV